MKGEGRSEDDMDTYSKENEALFYACEQSISRHIDEIASFVSDSWKKGGIRSVAAEACSRVAKCGKQRTSTHQKTTEL
jgi:hypothetical protein